MLDFFFQGWQSLGRTALAAVIAYIALVAILRWSGKRTLAKLSAFDLVVTVALGSTLSSILTSRDLPIADGVLAIAMLVGLQFLIAWLALRARWFERLVKSEPATLFRHGQFQSPAMRKERMTREEVFQAVRSAGIQDLQGVAIVVLEPDGSLSVIKEQQASQD